MYHTNKGAREKRGGRKQMENQLINRHILVSVDESKASLVTLTWAADNLYKQGDTIHLFHVIPPGQVAVVNTDLGIDEVVENTNETQRRIDHARDYLINTFVPTLDQKKIPYQLEIVKFATDTDSIGSIICKRAEQLNAAAVVMAKHNKGAIQEFFLGSAASYCTQHCRSPLVVMHAD